MSVRTLPPKDDPPLVIDPDAVEPLQIALERLETVAVQPCMADPSLTPLGGAGRARQEFSILNSQFLIIGAGWQWG